MPSKINQDEPEDTMMEDAPEQSQQDDEAEGEAEAEAEVVEETRVFMVWHDLTAWG